MDGAEIGLEFTREDEPLMSKLFDPNIPKRQ